MASNVSNLVNSNFDNESEVEQKFILQLLTGIYPVGLGYGLNDFKTKLNLRKIKLDKGSKEFIYFPDYLIIMNGIPLLIIEAKKQGEDLQEALREARLYATVINSSYSTKINPCSKVIATNGDEIIASYWDDEKFEIKVKASNFDISDPEYYTFLEFCKKDTLIASLNEIQKSVRKDTKFLKPIQLLGGSSIQNSSVGENSFGANLSIEYSYLFNPETEEEKKKIVENAYVGSKAKLSHVNSIDKVIRSIVSSSDDKTIITDTEKPDEILNAISDQTRIRNKVLLLVGSVGAGKSTFTTYLKEVVLPDDVKERTYWITFNMNNIPGRDLIHEWILDEALSIISKNPQIDDIYSYENLLKIFGKEISTFDKLAKTLLGDGDAYNKALYEEINKHQNNKQLFVKKVIKFLFTSRRITPIIVLDNVDKKDKDTQLLMFEIANWLVNNFNCTVFLPLRDETYENYKFVPPLDTVIKDFVFKIEPPLLESVIYKRFEFLVRNVGADKRSFHYYLKNGTKVECKRGEIINYIAAILKSIFQNTFFKRLMIGLSGKDTRRGLELFLDFCKSGHIPEEEIFKMRFNNEYDLPNFLVSRILLRGTRRYYSDSGTKIKNLFHSFSEDKIPDPFVRLSILRWLKAKFYEQGPNKTKGYHKINLMFGDLVSIGHSEVRLFSELKSLIENSCVITESQSLEHFTADDLVSVTSTGIVHLELLYNIDYLASVSEDTFFRNLQDAETIRDNIAGKDFSIKNHKENTLKNALVLVNYLEEYKKFLPAVPDNFLEKDSWKDYAEISDIKSFLDEKFSTSTLYKKELAQNSYPSGTKLQGQVVQLKNYGIFVEFGLDAQRGFIHVSKLISHYDPTYIETNFELGQNVDIEIIKYSTEHEKFDIRLI